MLHVLSPLAPLAFLIVYALKTRKMADAIFAVGGCWVVMIIAVPVFVPLPCPTPSAQQPSVSSAFCCWACCKRVQNKYPPVNGGIFAYTKSRAASGGPAFYSEKGNRFHGQRSGGGQVTSTGLPVTGCRNAMWYDHSAAVQSALLP